jgi:hypothetical protein
MMVEMNLTVYIINTYGNVTMKPPVQLIYASEFF